MKSLMLTFAVFFSVQTFAFAELHLVLGVDKTAYADESPLRFPCTKTLGNVSCGQIKFENATCERTFFVDRFVNKLELSCLINFRKVVIAYSDTGTYKPHSSQSRYGFYPLQLTDKVVLKKDAAAHTVLSLKP